METSRNEEYKLSDNSKTSSSNFAIDVLMGLNETPKKLPSKYIYDELGSKLFTKIMDLPEYYPTNCEAEIFMEYKAEILSYLNGDFDLIELGAGDGRKTRILLEYMLEQTFNFNYIPIDISKAAIRGLETSLLKQFPQLAVKGLVGEYFSALKKINKKAGRQNLVMFLGSNLGNFIPSAATNFLRSLRNSMKKGDLLLIGLDLKKDFSVLNRAYNDSLGITAQFNKNLLSRINKELGGNFNLNDFTFYSFYNPVSGAVESYLISNKPQQVIIDDLNCTFEFKKDEPISTEFSFKYSLEEAKQMAEESSFKVVKNFTDSKGYFLSAVWECI